jgi:hypothetical protein
MGLISEGHLFDSNILIYHINGQLDSGMELLLSRCFESPAYISTVTTMEVLSWPGHSDESIEMTTAFLEVFDEIAIDAEIKKCGYQNSEKLPAKIAGRHHCRHGAASGCATDYPQYKGFQGYSRAAAS